jgi:riboflavin synthase
LFTGLIESTGIVRATRKNARGARITIETELGGLAVGESVAVDGVCQTVAETAGNVFTCDVLPETLRISTLGAVRPGSCVNIERALGIGARLGGHIVMGHVDGVGRVARVLRTPLSLEIVLGAELFRYVVPKGSIAVNGVSLTVGPEPHSGRIAVFIIPHTWERTNLNRQKPGSVVNIEVDILAKYVERLIDVPRGSELP